MCVVELAGILRQHLQWLSETRPSLAVSGMSVAHSVDVRTCFVNGSVYQKASSIGWSGPVAANDSALEVDEDHVASFEKTEVDAQRVGPKRIMMLRIPNGDMTRDAQDITLARPMPESGGHVFKLPLAMCGEVIELRYAYSGSVNMLETAKECSPGRTMSP